MSTPTPNPGASGIALEPAFSGSRTDAVPEDVTTWRRRVDAAARLPVLAYVLSGVVWLLVGTVFALIASFKFSYPDWLGTTASMTFGRVRPAHLATMIYGWLSMVDVGIMIWLWGRLLKTPVRHPWVLLASCALWNLGVLVGTVGLLLGFSTGVEWIEMPIVAFFCIVPALGLVAFALLSSLSRRRVRHLYISVWYLGACMLWTPILLIAVLLPIYSGVPHATVNWWFAHNILGLWLTPVGLAAAYYFIPKVVGRPVYSYHLSYLGFWTLALFYNWAGVHHLVGGPPPQWVVTVSIVFSAMMIIPVLVVAVNHHMTAFARIKRVVYSPTLRFVVFGAMSYTVVSLQGALMPFRSLMEVTHFTHHTIAHSHLGVYAFATMIAFGSVYYILPRVTGWEWQSRRLIAVHFWTTGLGIGMYVVGLTAGGIIQGLMVNDASIPFIEVVNATKPWLWSRSVAGVLITVGHVVFAYLVWQIVRHRGPAPDGPVYFRTPPAGLFGRGDGGTVPVIPGDPESNLL